MDLGLRDSVIAITGGGAGIGQGISRACLAEGARVVVLSHNSAHVQKFVAETVSDSLPCELIVTELTETDQCRKAIEQIANRYGRLDGLVNNAGRNDGVGLESGSPERFEESLRFNLLHYYTLAHFALPMLKAVRGSIINISSKVALTGQGNTSAYAAAKGAQVALTREWAAELIKYGIRVNSVLPAEVLTPLYETWVGSQSDPQATLKHISGQIPLGNRMTTVAEIAAAVVFLLSPTQSGHTTAQNIVVDGGYVHLDRMLTAKRQEFNRS
jgi:L-fucose dehydrogenase